MEELKRNLEDFLLEDLVSIIISHPRKSEIKKIKIRPLLLKGVLFFQTSSYDEKSVFHKNLGREVLLDEIAEWMKEYRQLEADNQKEHMTVLVSKKGNIKIIRKRQKQQFKVQSLSHNRKKNYLLEEGTPVPFLIYLGVMTAEGKIISKKYDKFRQMNRYLEFIEDILPELPKDREIKIIDFGCGKSYLTFAMYYYLKEKKGYDIQMTGLDLKADVIMNCNLLAEKYGYQKCRFQIGNIADYEESGEVDMVVTLHACDTATDYALEKAVRWNAKVILSVPCCQHELNAQMHSDLLEPIFQYGILKERMAALFTDGMRAELLKQYGYEVQILEFIDMEHTPKNLLIRAIKIAEEKPVDPRERKRYQQLKEFLNVNPTLEKILPDRKKNHL